MLSNFRGRFSDGKSCLVDIDLLGWIIGSLTLVQGLAGVFLWVLVECGLAIGGAEVELAPGIRRSKLGLPLVDAHLTNRIYCHFDAVLFVAEERFQGSALRM